MAAAAIAAGLVLAAFVIPRTGSEHWRRSLYAGAAPIFGEWLPHLGWGTAPAIAIAIVVIRFGPTMAARLPWRRLLLVSWVTAVGWAFALAMVDGWQRGFAGRLTDSNEYLHEVPGVHDVSAMLHGFSGRILDFQPDSWTTHVSGHPPGALLFFVLLDRVGLGGGGWAGLICMLIGCSGIPAVAVALHALGAGDRARATLPFLTIAPAAIWIAVSADALFTAVAAWAVALLAIAVGQPRRWQAAVGSGMLFGFGVYLSYGLVIMALPAVAVLIAGRMARKDGPDGLVPGRRLRAVDRAGMIPRWGRSDRAIRLGGAGESEQPTELVETEAVATKPVGTSSVATRPVGTSSVATKPVATRPVTAQPVGAYPVARPLILAVAGALTVAVAFTLSGFWWLDGYHLVVQRYYQGIASERPYAYWVWANLAATLCAVGLATAAALPRALSPARLRALDPTALLVAAGLCAILIANVSGLSKAETERIWLPFDVWLLAATAFLPGPTARIWLVVQAFGTLLLAHTILTNW
jgi:hypothetical protein